VNRYELHFDQGPGCYDVRLPDDLVVEHRLDRLDQIDYVWDSQQADQITVLRVDHSETETTWQLGSSCAS
jgi:hypothetical protein